jgi:hypothetical protein
MAYTYLLFASLSFAQDDYLYKIMSGYWNQEQPRVQEVRTVEEAEAYVSDEGEAEAYSWNLGTPDNIPETEVIYGCGCE